MLFSRTKIGVTVVYLTDNKTKLFFERKVCFYCFNETLNELRNDIIFAFFYFYRIINAWAILDYRNR